MNQPDADETIDYNYAQQELMMKEYSNDPISEAISAVEQQYEEDKQGKMLFFFIQNVLIVFYFSRKTYIVSTHEKCH